jgi:hypothetical protein
MGAGGAAAAWVAQGGPAALQVRAARRGGGRRALVGFGHVSQVTSRRAVWFDAAHGAGRGWGRTAAAEACVLHRDADNFGLSLRHAKCVSQGMAD